MLNSVCSTPRAAYAGGWPTYVYRRSAHRSNQYKVNHRSSSRIITCFAMEGTGSGKGFRLFTIIPCIGAIVSAATSAR